ncbi:MAG: cysteine synthase, partial [Glaciihabitans sp.]|nr:cysteine synthase [Glaciihabitans sp.]
MGHETILRLRHTSCAASVDVTPFRSTLNSTLHRTIHRTLHNKGPRMQNPRNDTRAWVQAAIRIVNAEANRSADTHLRSFPLPSEWGIDLYLKDESVHPTGSLKHRLAR